MPPCPQQPGAPVPHSRAEACGGGRIWHVSTLFPQWSPMSGLFSAQDFRRRAWFLRLMVPTVPLLPKSASPPQPPRTFCTCGFPPIPRGVTLPVPSPPPHTLVPSLTAPPTLISPVPSPSKRRHAQAEHLHAQPRPRPLLLLTPASPLLAPGTALAVSPTPLWGWEPRRGLSARGCEHTRDAQHGGSPQNRGWCC